MKKNCLKLISLISSSILSCTLITTPIKTKAISPTTFNTLKNPAFISIASMSSIYIVGTGLMIANIVTTNERLNSKK